MYAELDVFLRKAAARATTNRKGPTYTRLLKEMIEEDFGKRWPTDLNCDQEFKFGFKKDPKNKGEEANFMQLLVDNNVAVHFLEMEEANKNSIMERFIRTLREMLAKATWALDQPNWLLLLLSLISNYNQTYHRSIAMSWSSRMILQDSIHGWDANLRAWANWSR